MFFFALRSMLQITENYKFIKYWYYLFENRLYIQTTLGRTSEQLLNTKLCAYVPHLNTWFTSKKWSSYKPEIDLKCITSLLYSDQNKYWYWHYSNTPGMLCIGGTIRSSVCRCLGGCVQRWAGSDRLFKHRWQKRRVFIHDRLWFWCYDNARSCMISALTIICKSDCCLIITRRAFSDILICIASQLKKRLRCWKIRHILLLVRKLYNMPLQQTDIKLSTQISRQKIVLRVMQVSRLTDNAKWNYFVQFLHNKMAIITQRLLTATTSTFGSWWQLNRSRCDTIAPIVWYTELVAWGGVRWSSRNAGAMGKSLGGWNAPFEAQTSKKRMRWHLSVTGRSRDLLSIVRDNHHIVILQDGGHLYKFGIFRFYATSPKQT